MLKKSIRRSPSRIALLLIPLVFACFAPLQRAQAVVPPPDGGYPNFNAGRVIWERSITNGSRNTAAGAQARARSQHSWRFDTPNGAFALQNNITGSNNTAVGFGALINSTGTANIGVGLSAGDFVTSANNVICIGTGLSGANVSNSCFIDNIRGVTTQNANAISVVIDSAGQLGTMSSSRRLKKEVKPMDNTSEAILGLKPVTFHYENDKTDTPQFGLIAEEVAEVNPDLVVRDERGEIYSVRYDAVNAMLLNEFLKEHEAFVEEHLKVQQQKKEMDVLKTELKEQRALIQKVSDRIELKSSTSQIVANDQ